MNATEIRVNPDGSVTALAPPHHALTFIGAMAHDRALGALQDWTRRVNRRVRELRGMHGARYDVLDRVQRECPLA